MVLAVDAGNTNIVIAGYEKDRLVFSSRIATQTELTADEYVLKFRDILGLNGRSAGDVEGVALSNVSTPLSGALKEAAERIGGKVMAVGPGIKTGVDIKIDDPSSLGADLVCSAAGAIAKYSPPCIIFDFGTATKITAIDDQKRLLGCSIIPGVKISLRALSERAAALPAINVELAREKLIGTNTIESMQSGIIYGTACMTDGMTARFKEALGEKAVTLATGGLSKAIIPHCREDIIQDDNLILDGLYALYRKNM